MEILAQTDRWIAINKPAGLHVHPPERGLHRIPRRQILLYQARDFIGRPVFPVHRLDVATCGVLLMALDSATAGELCRAFAQRQVLKTYEAVVRGWTPERGLIDIPLLSDSSGEPLAALTRYRRQAQIEIDAAVGKRHSSARYSLLTVEPETGRFHQIRRHFNRLSHPLIGDGEHGDSHHNRFFREQLGLSGLLLKATNIEFTAPEGDRRQIAAPDDERWTQIRQMFQVIQR